MVQQEPPVVSLTQPIQVVVGAPPTTPPAPTDKRAKLLAYLKDHYALISAMVYLAFAGWGILWLFWQAPASIPIGQLISAGDILKHGVLRGVVSLAYFAGGVGSACVVLYGAAKLDAWVGDRKGARRFILWASMAIACVVAAGGLLSGCLDAVTKAHRNIHAVVALENSEFGPYQVAFEDEQAPRCLYIYIMLDKYAVFVDRDAVLAHEKKLDNASNNAEFAELDRSWPVLIVGNDKVRSLQRGDCPPKAAAPPNAASPAAP